MGGILAKKIALSEKSKESKFFENLKGIVFYSCPHFGSKVLEDIHEEVSILLRRHLYTDTILTEVSLDHKDVKSIVKQLLLCKKKCH